MKKLLVILLLSLLLGQLNAQSDSLQSVVTTLVVNGTTYKVNQKFPEEICGEYLKGKKGHPNTLLNGDGTGYFQRTGPPHPIKFWIECDVNGNIKKNWLFDGNYTVNVVYQYNDESVRAVWGEFEVMEIKVAYDQGYSIIFEERFHNFRKK